MPDELAAVLELWVAKAVAPPLVALRRASRPAQLWLFPGSTGANAWTGGPPGYKPLDVLVAAGSAVGVDGFTFQSLRHSWATHGEYWGLGETMIQRQLRHTTRKTQQVYRHADLANLATSVRAISFVGPSERGPKVAQV
jgi:integrase